MIVRLFGAAVVVVAAALLSGCAGVGFPGGAPSCVSWVDFEDPQAMFDDATLVVSGIADPADGTIDLISGPGERHRFEVDEVFKGEFAGDELWVAAPRDYCVAEPPQPAEDPIPSGERVLLFLTPASAEPVPVGEEPDVADVEAWSTLTPLDGVLPFPEGAELPAIPPEGG